MALYRRIAVIAACIGMSAGIIIPAAVGNPGSGGVTTTLASRALLADSVDLNQDRIKFQTKDPTNVLMQTITFHPLAYSGWHYHPGMVMVVVQSGTVTTHDADCNTKTYGVHESFVESGTDPFMVTNDTGVDAVVYATLVAPAGSKFRIETDPPACAA